MRLRFAPSPTGFLHIGNARTALANFIIAKKTGAGFTLRIEDTDFERSTKASEESILRDLKWLGIEWDEGPDKGGPNGPYRQSERFDIYKKYTERLLAEGNAYLCYCSKEELEASRKGTDEIEGLFEYNGRCRNLSPDQRAKFEAEGRKPTVRFRVPENVEIRFNDHIKGETVFNSGNIGGDFIIVRSDGVPVYNYIVVLDDHLMKITSVIRGEDHLSNTPKQVLIHKALGFDLPEYAHHSLILGPDRSKLSKRHGITSVAMYRDNGYLPEAIVNYMLMLGWATDSGEEILTQEEIIRQIDIQKIGTSAAIFDFQKLKWMNGIYIKQYALGKLTDLLLPHIEEAGYKTSGLDRSYLESVINTARNYCEVLPDIKSIIGMFLDEVFIPDEESDALLKEDDSKKLIAAAHDLVNGEINDTNFREKLINAIKDRTSFKGKKLFHPVRALLTGRLKGPDMDIAMPLIGFDKCKKRIEYCHKTYCGK